MLSQSVTRTLLTMQLMLRLTDGGLVSVAIPLTASAGRFRLPPEDIRVPASRRAQDPRGISRTVALKANGEFSGRHTH